VGNIDNFGDIPLDHLLHYVAFVFLTMHLL
jgi:hypothetical protein